MMIGKRISICLFRYTKFVELCGDKIQIIGDQLIESNTHRLTEAIGKHII